MIYLPNHRSHLDYILLSFALAQFEFRTPYIAAGDNLDIPVFSWFLRSLGAFFIKRRLDKDFVYRAVLHSVSSALIWLRRALCARNLRRSPFSISKSF